MTEVLVEWPAAQVGRLTYEPADMWYVEGDFEPADSAEATAFVDLASRLDALLVMDQPRRGTRAVLLSGDVDTPGCDALVLSLKDARLFVRLVCDRQAVAWLRRHVK